MSPATRSNSKISVIDTESDEVTKVLEAPCPHLHIVNKDTDGNIWMSNGQGSIPAAAVSPEHARNCFVRIHRSTKSSQKAGPKSASRSKAGHSKCFACAELL